MIVDNQPLSRLVTQTLSSPVNCEPSKGRNSFIFVSLVFCPISNMWDKQAKGLLNELMHAGTSADFIELPNYIIYIHVHTTQFCQLHHIIGA